LDKVFANFQLNTEFFIALGLFFTITLIISIIIVFFITKIRTLNYFLEQAKEIDELKIAKISALEMEIQEEKLTIIALEKEQDQLIQAKERIVELSNHIDHLKSDLALQVREHTEHTHHQEKRYAELRIHYAHLEETHQRLSLEHQQLQSRYERLLQENTLLQTALRESEVELREKQRETTEKIELMREHRSELKEEFEHLASRILESNSNDSLRSSTSETEGEQRRASSL